MKLDYTAYRFYLDVLQLAGTIAIGIYVYLSNRIRVTSKRFETLEKEVAKRSKAQDLADAIAEQAVGCKLHQSRTVKLENNFIELKADFKNGPTHHHLERIHERLDSLTEKLGKIDGSLSGINRAVDLINEHLINKGS